MSDLIESGVTKSSSAPYLAPTDEMHGDPLFNAIWGAIKSWDISRHNDGIYSGPTGNDARHIYDAIKRVQP